MKAKLSEWGNSHGMRITTAMMKHLNIQPGDEVDVRLTDQGIEILKRAVTVNDLHAVAKKVLTAIKKTSKPVAVVEDPYAESKVAYIVIDINPCAPLIREVPVGTKGAFATLADAKEAARQILQTSIADAQKSLSELRQLGINNINYISL